MNQRRRAITDAAITLVGRQGSHSLTHRRVDAEAKLPPGSTSNHFRTHKALVDGVLDRLLELDLEQANQARPLSEIDDRQQLIEVLVGSLALSAGAARPQTRARISLMTETMNDPVRSEQIVARRHAVAGMLETVAHTLGAPAEDAGTVASVLLDHLKGTLMHRLTEPDRPLEELVETSRRSFELLVTALLPDPPRPVG